MPLLLQMRRYCKRLAHFINKTSMFYCSPQDFVLVTVNIHHFISLIILLNCLFVIRNLIYSLLKLLISPTFVVSVSLVYNWYDPTLLKHNIQ